MPLWTWTYVMKYIDFVGRSITENADTIEGKRV